MKNKQLTAVGFEPTRIAPSELESDALDHSATLSLHVKVAVNTGRGRLLSEVYFYEPRVGGHLGRVIQAAAQSLEAGIAQLGERQTEDLKVPGSIPGLGIEYTIPVLMRGCG